jgi:hypothetical protein
MKITASWKVSLKYADVSEVRTTSIINTTRKVHGIITSQKAAVFLLITLRNITYVTYV